MLTFYDDLATVEKFYPAVKAYIDYLLQGVDGRGVLITPGQDYGDWVAPIGCDDAWNKANGQCTMRKDGREYCAECGENGTDLSPNPPSAKHVGLLLSTAQVTPFIAAISSTVSQRLSSAGAASERLFPVLPPPAA